MVNVERTKRGLKALTLDTKLSNVATMKSQDMIDKNYFDHNSPTYGSPFDMMRKFGISYRSAGENIAEGQRSPEEVMNAWMNSEGHRKNILNPNFTTLGVGVAKTYRSAGENIAEGQRSPEEVMNAWMNSEGHRKNILNPNFTTLGVGVAKTSSGRLYWTQMFIG